MLDIMYGPDDCFLFVYGTLKRGLANHDYLNGATFVSSGHVVGTIWWLTAGIPIIRVPTKSIMVRGNHADPDDDIQRLKIVEQRPPRSHGAPLVDGEIFKLPREKFVQLLPRIDALEDFHGPESSVYIRVAVMAIPDIETGMEPLAAWTYVDANPQLLRKPIMKGGFP
ncbi:MAG: gamma-glutamylcyclotransferase [Candidatus Sumerlaeia bacterium]|nr:gamma-glutamylcyclotransferase [Candidatus Sumerlaeia bacterium]